MLLGASLDAGQEGRCCWPGRRPSAAKWPGASGTKQAQASGARQARRTPSLQQRRRASAALVVAAEFLGSNPDQKTMTRCKLRGMVEARMFLHQAFRTKVYPCYFHYKVVQTSFYFDPETWGAFGTKFYPCYFHYKVFQTSFYIDPDTREPFWTKLYP